MHFQLSESLNGEIVENLEYIHTFIIDKYPLNYNLQLTILKSITITFIFSVYPTYNYNFIITHHAQAVI